MEEAQTDKQGASTEATPDEVMELSLEEGRRMFDKTTEVTDKTEDRAFATIRINLLILSIIAASMGLSATDGISAKTFGTITIMLPLSTTVAIFTFLKKNTIISPDQRWIRSIQEADDMSEKKEEMATTYAKWAQKNQEKNSDIHKKLAFCFGITLSAIGVFGLQIILNVQ